MQDNVPRSNAVGAGRIRFLIGENGNDILRLRKKRIDHFTLRQRREKKFIKIADLIEDAVIEPLRNAIDEDLRRQAYYRLFAKDLLDGFFGRYTSSGIKSQVRFLSEHVPMWKMSGQRLTNLLETFDVESRISNYLSHCWLRSDDALRWCVRAQIAQKPGLLKKYKLGVEAPRPGPKDVLEAAPPSPDIQKSKALHVTGENRPQWG
ncbi:hypothetical protein AMST5_02467 [freshwater sediment metagenome]|uniref:Uncharacterized protein n=1 Tax=freshwater sediment metagenome TaxID=556182 RepID=A0AA48M4J7_9ZZZZ